MMAQKAETDEASEMATKHLKPETIEREQVVFEEKTMSIVTGERQDGGYKALLTSGSYVRMWAGGATREEAKKKIIDRINNEEGWVRVHSDADETKTDEELIVRNLLREMIEKFYDVPTASAVVWWSLVGQRWESLVVEYAEKIAKEYEV